VKENKGWKEKASSHRKIGQLFARTKLSSSMWSQNEIM